MRFTAHLLPVVPSTGFAHKLATYFSQCGTEETLEHREKAEQWGREGVGGVDQFLCFYSGLWINYPAPKPDPVL